ncbi:MAG TPA: putative glycoside hydrolase [Thermomicrobiales bacterium]|nr:putative glycoside hydrolase [Thermomicrobiales bacterium]
MSWWYSLILAVPLIVLFAMALTSGSDDDDGLTGVVRDAFTGDPVSGAVVSTANATATTNGDGAFTVADLTATSLFISREDYASTQVAVTSPDIEYDVSLRPTTVHGTVKNEKNGDPIAGVTVTATAPDGTSITTQTNEDGEYTLENVPDGAEVTVTFEGFTVATLPLGSDANLDFKIRPDVLTGLVTDEEGKPVAGASVSVGTATTTTNADGTYRVAGIGEDAKITIRKPGFLDVTADVPKSLTYDTTMTRFLVKAIYSTAQYAASDELWGSLIDIADTTEVNAMVLDLKDSSGNVFYDTKVPLATQIGAKKPMYDINERLQEMKDHNVYSIARIVVFEDPILAGARNELAIHDVTTGGLWTTWDGLAWVNAHQREVWQYNIDLAVEAAELGFDEIQLDYIRFPSDGMLENADYGSQFANETRVDAITGFLTQMQSALKPTSSLLAVDIFGITLLEDDDAGIGQHFASIVPLVDVICPMIYPSHFYPGEMGFDIPNNHPYDVIMQSLQRGVEMVPDSRDKLRPWLQDFSYGEGIKYGAPEVAAQIQATVDFGTAGWLIWAPDNVYSVDAFSPE